MLKENYRFGLILGLICLLFSCSADVNFSKCEINVKQGETDIPYETGYFDFGNIPLGFSQSITFTIENTGIETLELTGDPVVQVSSTDSSEFLSLVNLTNTTIADEESTTFVIQFIPESMGQKTAKVLINNNCKGKNPFTFNIVGNCTLPAPEIHVKQGDTDILSPNGKYDFGLVSVGKSSEDVIFTIENNGNEDLELTGIPNKVSISGSGASMFVVEQSNLQSNIPGSSSTSFTISFVPTTTGIKNAMINIINNDSDENPYSFILTGTGVAGSEINVKKGAINILSGSGKYNFDVVLINESSAEATFIVENLGSTTLHLSDAPDHVKITGSDAGLFSVNLTATDEFVSAGESTTFGLTFSPISLGTKTATISIANNDNNESLYTFEVFGTGVNPEINVKQGSENIPNSTGSYTFNSQIIGSTLNIEFIMENFGQGDLKLTGSPLIEISGPNSSEFSANTTLTSTRVSAGSSTTFKLSFTPSSKGAKNATVSIANNDNDENPYTFELNGVGLRLKYEWTKRFGGSDGDRSFSVDVDNANNVYLTGIFSKTVNFGADFGVSDSKSTNGGSDIYVTKINSNGSYAWTKTFGGIDNDSYASISIDPTGNVFITGTFKDTVNFGDDFGITDTKTSTIMDIFVTKINSNGTYGWTKMFGGPRYGISCESITTDSLGNVFITGYFSGSVDFGADFGVKDVKSTSNISDAFVTKINANGTYGWAREIGGGWYDRGFSIASDSNNNIFVTGLFNGTVNFGEDFGVTDNKINKGDADIFVLKINSDGTYGWTRSMGGSDNDMGYSICVDPANNIYVTGSFRSTVNFGSDFGEYDSKKSAGVEDIFVTKIISNGTYGWTKRYGNNGKDVGNSITTDSSGNIFVVGDYHYTVDFGTDFGTVDSKASSGSTDVFITRINSDGSYGWTKKFGNSDFDYGNSIAIDSSNSIYIVGGFNNTVNFGDDFSTSDSKISLGSLDIFITKLSQ